MRRSMRSASTTTIRHSTLLAILSAPGICRLSIVMVIVIVVILTGDRLRDVVGHRARRQHVDQWRDNDLTVGDEWRECLRGHDRECHADNHRRDPARRTTALDLAAERVPSGL